MVVGGMSHRYLTCPGDIGCLSEEGVAHLSGGFFEGETVLLLICRHAAADCGGRYTEVPRKGPYIPGIGCRLGSAEAVVDVSEADPDAELWLERRQDIEETYGVSSAGHADDDGPAGRNEVVVLHKAEDTVANVLDGISGCSHRVTG